MRECDFKSAARWAYYPFQNWLAHRPSAALNFVSISVWLESSPECISSSRLPWPEKLDGWCPPQSTNQKALPPPLALWQEAGRGGEREQAHCPPPIGCFHSQRCSVIVGVLRHMVDGASGARNPTMGNNLHNEELSLVLQVSQHTLIQVNEW